MRRLYLLLVVALTLGLSSVAFAQSDTATVTLAEVGGSGISGTAWLTDNGDGTTMVKLQLEGSPEGAVHPAHIHEGNCGENGEIVFPLTNVENGMSETTVEESLEALLDEDYYINVHKSAEEVATIVACGETDMAEMPNGGGGGMANSQNSIPVAGLALAGLALAAGALMVVRLRSA